MVEKEDFNHIVDEVSDDEGDEEAGKVARQAMAAKEEKEKHLQIMRRMRDGYDGRRGGIVNSSSEARGQYRFDQLIAADNRESAKALGLLNDDELLLEEEENNGDEKKNKKEEADEDDEAALLDQYLRDRHLTKTDLLQDEAFSDEEEEDKEEAVADGEEVDEDELEQIKQAKQFTKRARMNRILESTSLMESSQQELRLSEQDRKELKYIKDVSRKRSRWNANPNVVKKQKTTHASSGGSTIALLTNMIQPLKRSRSVLSRSNTNTSSSSSSSSYKTNVSLGRPVLFQDMRRSTSLPTSTTHKFSKHKHTHKKSHTRTSQSLWNKVSNHGFRSTSSNL